MRGAMLRSGYAKALAAALLFAIVNVAARRAVDDVDPLLGAAVMYGLAGAVLAPLLAGFRLPERGVLGRMTLMTVLGGAVAPVALFLGFAAGATAVTTSLLVPLEMVFTALLAALFLRERVTGLEAGALALLFSGALVLTGAGVMDAAGVVGVPLVGILLVMLANLSWAGDNTVSAPLTRRVPIPHLIAVKTLLGALLVTAAALALRVPLTLTMPAFLALAFAGIFGVGVSTLLFYGALRDIGATRTSIVFSTSALFGAVAGAVLLQEPLGWPHLVAAVLVAGGLWLLTWRERGAGKKPS